ncbi:MAG TPA: hypothetical protein VEQ85_11885 [Lacipirellulaceae bacterium]|nr:hypothetical protein [Lacipirellulaceae bacterium]
MLAAVGDRVSYRWGRLDEFDDPRLAVAAIAVAAALAALFVGWLYRRESGALPRWAGFVLGGLRLMALAGAIVYFLNPVKRADQEVVTQSRVAVLVDSSQSMAVQDERAAEAAGATRSDAAVAALQGGGLLEALRQQHDVSVWGFDSTWRRVAQWERAGKPDSPNRDSAAPPAVAPVDATGDGERAPNRTALDADQLRPLGAETRLGDALAAIQADQTGGPLAGVVLLSDGGHNRGVDPLAVADALAAANAPVAAVGLGSTEPRRNVRVQELIAPSRAYPEDKVTVRALIHAESYNGRTVTVELSAREAAPDAAAVRIGEAEATFESDADTVEVEFDLEPAVVGPLELEARVAAPADDQYADDNQRSAEVEVVDANTRVLLVASGATRDYRFLRNQLRRDRRMTVDVWLQGAPAGISQDADKILTSFPASKDELFAYDAIVAFDADWMQLETAQVDLLEEWVAQEAGGLIVVAGPINTAAWLQSADHAKIRALYPVEFQRRLTLLDDGLFGSRTPWPLDFTREGQEADFLWLGDTPAESRANWQKFPGVFGCYAVRGPKPGAQVYARYSDPDASLTSEPPVYFADHFYGAGRVFYMGSGELWRLRAVDVGYFEILYTQLVRHVSEGRLLRGSSFGRLLVERDRYFVGDTVVVRAQLATASREPFVAPSVAARVVLPSRERGDSGGAEGGRTMALLADPARPGNYIGQFAVSSEGAHRIELTVPEAPDEVLAKRINVTVPDLEFADTRRNEALLAAIAKSTGGKYYQSPALAANGASGTPPLAELLPSRAVTKIRVGKPDEAFTEAVNRVLLGVICGALCLEWLLRRLLRLA